MPADESERLLIGRIRQRDAGAWQELIARYEGRLLAFVDSRLRNRTASEDVVQETFVGFLISLPNYDAATPLESYLFSIAAHKLTDTLRREGRRPALPLFVPDEDGRVAEPVGKSRKASSIARGRERELVEERVLGDCLQSLIETWKQRGEFERLQVMELLLVLGWQNKTVAERLGLSEQAVANHKHFVVQKLKDAATSARLRDFDPAALGLA